MITVSIKEVAKRAGVSTATVSRAINNSGYVNAETRVKILEIVDELGFVPNFGAQILRSSKSRIIVLLVKDLEESFYMELASHIERESALRNYRLVLSNTGDDVTKERKSLVMIESMKADGVIDTTGSTLHERIKNKPLVIFDKFDIKFNHHDLVGSDNKVGGQLATEHLIELGCERLLMVVPKKKSYKIKKRAEGFLDVVVSNAAIGRIFECDSLEALVNYDYSLYEGIFASNDELAVDIMSHLLRTGIDVPKDMKIVGYDNSEISKKVYPSVTTINPDIKGLAKLLVESLINRVESPKPNALRAQQVIMKPTLVVRESTGGSLENINQEK